MSTSKRFDNTTIEESHTPPGPPVAHAFRAFLFDLRQGTCQVSTAATAPEPPTTDLLFRDPALPLAQRVDDLISRLTR